MKTCSMSDHGSSTATADCCRPDSPKFMGEEELLDSGLHLGAETFWNDGPVWKSAGKNTLNCLVGCSIGDFGMMFYLSAYHPQLPVPITMALAMATGLLTSIALETVLLHFRESFTWQGAAKMAFSMSIISMLGMEFAATLTDYSLTGGAVEPGTAWFWIALGISLAVGFLAPLPYNYYKLKKHGQACH